MTRDNSCGACEFGGRKVEECTVHGKENGCRGKQEKASRHDVVVKGDSHERIANSLKYGCRNYECKNLHGSEMFSRVVCTDNAFRTVRESGAHIRPGNVEKEGAGYGDTRQALNKPAIENAN